MNAVRSHAASAQLLLWLITWMSAILLMTAERGGVSLPCFAKEAGGPMPCERVKFLTTSALGIPPSMAACVGSAVLLFLATMRITSRKGSGLSVVSHKAIRLTLILAVCFSFYLLIQQLRGNAWCGTCLILNALFLIGAVLEPWAAKSPRASTSHILAVIQLPFLTLITLSSFYLPVVSELTFRQQLASALPTLIDPKILEEISPCGYSKSHPVARDQASWSAPFAHGSKVSPVHLAVFHDPFCALCRQLDGEMQEILARTAGKVRLLSFPIPHTDNSLEATRYLHAASLARWPDESVATMVDQFSTLVGRADADVSREGLKQLLSESGLDVSSLIPVIESGRADVSIRRSEEQFAILGGTMTPLVVINGRVVDQSASSTRGACMSRLMDDAAKGLDR